MQLFIPYRYLAPILKWLTLSLFAYVAVLFSVDIPWTKLVVATLIPPLELTREYLMLLVAVLGTTISPYLFFWQASQEVEEQRATAGDEPLRDSAQRARATSAADQDRHMARHDVLQRDRVLDHADDGRHAAQRRHHRHRNIGAGRAGAEADRRPVRLHAVRRGDHRHRAARDSRCSPARPRTPLPKRCNGRSGSASNR